MHNVFVDLADAVMADPTVQGLCARLAAAGPPAGANGLWGSSAPILAAVVARQLARPLLHVTAHLDQADDARDDMETALGRAVDVLPAWETLPGEGLPLHLERGPTPAGPSFTVTRLAVPVARAAAGANQEFASASFDDNEATSWTNDNQLATAWIQYEFARPARPAEVVLKLNGWRSLHRPAGRMPAT